MVFDGPTPLKSIEKQALFLIFGHYKNDEKTMPKETSIIFGRPPDGPTNRTNGAVERPTVYIYIYIYIQYFLEMLYMNK